jgi:hypothetical protein
MKFIYTTLDLWTPERDDFLVPLFLPGLYYSLFMFVFVSSLIPFVAFTFFRNGGS